MCMSVLFIVIGCHGDRITMLVKIHRRYVDDGTPGVCDKRIDMNINIHDVYV